MDNDRDVPVQLDQGRERVLDGLTFFHLVT